MRKIKTPVIVSLRASTLKFAGVLIAGVLIVTALVIFLPPERVGTPAVSTETIDYAGVETAQDVARFLRQFGATSDDEFLFDRTVTLPERYEGVFAGYNRLQEEQGFRLCDFAGKKLRRVVVSVRLGEDDGAYLATLFLYRGSVVGGDISEADPTGQTMTFAQAAQRAGKTSSS